MTNIEYNSEKQYRAYFWNIITHYLLFIVVESAMEVVCRIFLETSGYLTFEYYYTSEIVILFLAILISRGACSRAAVAKGANDAEEYNLAFSNGFYIALIGGILIAIALGIKSVFFSNGAIQISQDPGSLMALFGEMFYVAVYPVFFLFREFTYLRGDKKSAFIGGMIYLFGSILTAFLFIETEMGATFFIVGRFISLFVGILVLYRSLRRDEETTIKTFHWNFRYIFNLLLDGVPITIGYLVTTVSVMICSALYLGQMSSDYLYFFSGIRITMLYVYFFQTVFTLIVTLQIGPLAGAGETGSMHERMKGVLAAAMGFGLVSGIVLLFLYPFFFSGLGIPDTDQVTALFVLLRLSTLFIGAYSVIWSLIQYFHIIRQRKKSYMLIGGMLVFYILVGATLALGGSIMSVMGAIEFLIIPVFISIFGWIMFKWEMLEQSSDDKPKDSTMLSLMVSWVSEHKKTILLDVLYSFVLIGIMAVTMMFSYQSEILPDISHGDYFNFENRSIVMANDGVTVLADNYFPAHELCESLEEVGPYLGKSVIAREDERFYSHHGVDYESIARAAVSAVVYRFVQGGSTITMQLVKNTILSNFGQMRTINRKLSEVLLALQMERCYTKDEILLMYLNNINFGNGYYGVKSAARHYFQKEPSELTLAEAVSLSCLSQHPNDYEMAENSEFALKLRGLTLKPMVECGFITQEEADQAAGELIDWNPFEVIINHSNVTPTLEHLPIVRDGDVYMAVEDVSTYLDESICIREKEGFLSTFGKDQCAIFDLKTGAFRRDNYLAAKDLMMEDPGSTGLITENGVYYLSLSCLSDLYNIDVTANEDGVTILSRDRGLLSALVKKDAYVRYLNFEDSYAVGVVGAGEEVFVQDTAGDVYEGWSRIRTKDLLTGYVKTTSLTKPKIIRESAEKEESAGGNNSVNTVRVMIPEGASVDEVIQLLAKNGVSSEAALWEAASYADFGYSYTDDREKGTPYMLEGFLFPDTYDFYRPENATSALKRMVDNFDLKISAHKDEIEACPYNLKELITIASMVEAETAKRSERKLVASVIYNRLENGYPLEIDSTLIYAGKVLGLDEVDTTVNSGYNTYENSGLPVGPICNPSESAIEAALNPADSAYLYFAQGTNKKTYFFKNFEKFLDFLNSDFYGGKDLSYFTLKR